MAGQVVVAALVSAVLSATITGFLCSRWYHRRSQGIEWLCRASQISVAVTDPVLPEHSSGILINGQAFKVTQILWQSELTVVSLERSDAREAGSLSK
jgi:hypothetical protein